VPRETSILNILAKATDKTTGAALSDAQIVAQAQVRVASHLCMQPAHIQWYALMLAYQNSGQNTGR